MDQLYNIWLCNIQNINYTKATLLLKFFKTAENIYKSTQKQLIATGLHNNIIDAVSEAKKTNPQKLIDILNKKGVHFVSVYEDCYPYNLKQIDAPPLGLYIKGSLSNFKNINNIAIVGARKCSEYGVLTTLRLSKYFAQKNMTVVSGMAKGIDTFAHKGAIEANGITIAVLGCGVDICYPKENNNLYEKILATGIIISEYFPETPPLPYHFPMRNRIISGICKGIVVVEANKNSGSLITADTALAQGRDVFAVPGNITSRLSYGTNNLIKQGAIILTHPQDVLNNLNITEVPNQQNIAHDNLNEKILAPNEKLVYDCISFETISIDEIYDKLSLSLEELNYSLTILELKGFISRLPGGRYTID